MENIGLSHLAASALFERESARVGVLSDGHSVVNRTLASQTTLFHRRPSISRRVVLRKYRRYRRLYRDRAVAGMPWTAEYVERMAQLMDRSSLVLDSAPPDSGHAPGTIRTCDLCLRRAALYPLSYGRGEGECSCVADREP